MTLGKRIKKLRQDKGLTQAQLGYMVNKGESTVRTWELDRSQPSPQTIRLLCDVLGTTPNALLGKEEKEEPVEMVTISFSALVDLSLGSGLSLDYLMGKDEPAFNSTPLEGMSKEQASLYMLTEFLSLIDKEYPKIPPQQKAALISEFYKHDPIKLLLSALNNELSKQGSDEK